MNKQYWAGRIQNTEPYIPGEQPKDRRYVKLNTNENPYPPSPKVQEALGNVAISDLRLYPDPDCLGLRTSAGHPGQALSPSAPIPRRRARPLSVLPRLRVS